MILSTQALVSMAQLRAWLCAGRTLEAAGRLADAPLAALAEAASAAIGAWCGRRLLAPAEPEIYRLDGTGGSLLLLPEWPVVELLDLTIDGQTVPPREPAGSLGYMVREREGLLLLSGRGFARGVGNIEVRARLGYCRMLAASEAQHQTALATLGQACLLLAAHWHDKPAAGAYATRDDGLAVRYPAERLPAEVEGLLRPFRRHAV